MTPYTLADAEQTLRTALDHGDPTGIAAAVEAYERLEQPTAPAALHAAALWYAEQGLAVFPLQPGTKIPFKRTRGCKDATTDRTQVDTWWTTNPDANIGIATGGLVDVIDIDGQIGQASRLAHWSMFEALDDQLLGKVSTPRPGGMHLFVPAAGQGNKAGLLPGIDYRGAGGYVVAPPSRTDQGAYRWLTPLQHVATAAVA